MIGLTKLLDLSQKLATLPQALLFLGTELSLTPLEVSYVRLCIQKMGVKLPQLREGSQK